MMSTIFALMFLGMAGGKVGERKIEYSGGASYIEVRLSTKLTEDQNVQTVVKFPEQSLQTLISGWSQDDISVVAHGDKLFIKLLRPKTGFLDVLGESGNLYRLFINNSDDNYDTYVVIEDLRKKKGVRKITAIEVMKAMRMGRMINGAQITRFSGEPLYEVKGIKIVPMYSYAYGYYKGYIFRVDNHSGTAYEIDVTKFRSDKLLLIGSTSPAVGNGQKGYIFCIFYR